VAVLDALLPPAVMVAALMVAGIAAYRFVRSESAEESHPQTPESPDRIEDGSES